MRYTFILFSLLFLLLSCADKEYSSEKNEEIVPVEPVYKYGFNLSEYTLEQDTVKPGDTFGKIMANNNIDPSTVFEISNKTHDVFDAKKLKIGKPYILVFDKKQPEKPHSFIYIPSLTDYTVIQMKDSVFAYNKQRKITTVEKQGYGSIKNSLNETILSSGMSHELAYKLSKIFDYAIDFFRLQSDDYFKVIYEERYVDDTLFAGISKVKAAMFFHNKKPFYAFNFTTDSISGKKGFYDENGNTMRRMFLKAPLDIFRISSRFSMNRFHPVQKRWKAHKGTDYAAPKGTPIRATASGVVTQAGFTSANGNYVKIRHNKTYETQYLHMSKILVKKGQRVEQGHIIGKVGSTGLATGPHVCYRFWKNGTQVDPLKEITPPAQPIDDKLKKQYLQFVKPLKTQLDNIPQE